MTTSITPPPPLAPKTLLPAGIDLRALTGELVRDLIRGDPELWARVQSDPALRREFGFGEQ